jgi:hypothetical protein
LIYTTFFLQRYNIFNPYNQDLLFVQFIIINTKQWGAKFTSYPVPIPLSQRKTDLILIIKLFLMFLSLAYLVFHKERQTLLLDWSLPMYVALSSNNDKPPPRIYLLGGVGYMDYTML